MDFWEDTCSLTYNLSSLAKCGSISPLYSSYELTWHKSKFGPVCTTVTPRQVYYRKCKRVTEDLEGKLGYCTWRLVWDVKEGSKRKEKHGVCRHQVKLLCMKRAHLICMKTLVLKCNLSCWKNPPLKKHKIEHLRHFIDLSLHIYYIFNRFQAIVSM